jgi:rhamnosyl/mannosyltransferase
MQTGVEGKLHVIPMGLDFSRLDPSCADEAMTARLDTFADQRPLLLTVGRHVYYKGYEYLLAAMAQLRSDCVLAMVGVGPERENLRRLTAELGMTNRVLFLGEVGPAELTAAILRCDVFTLPSIEPSEAFGIASAEAMACGKPTVVCQLNNGVNFLNRDGVTGLTVAPRDTEALADAIDLLIRDNAMWARMGVEAAAWVRSHFSLDAMRAGTIDLYRALS